MRTKFPGYLKIILLLLVALAQSLTVFASTSETQTQSGDSLIQEGLLFLERGQPDKALQVWQKAHKIYKESQDLSGIHGSLINQSLALQELGQYYNSCTLLTKILTLNHKICQSDSGSLKQYELNVLPSKDSSLEPDQQVIAYNNLGDVLRFLGQLKSSEVILKQALINTEILDPEQHSTIELSLANTYQSIYKQAHNQLSISSDPRSQDENLSAAQTNALSALDSYQKLSKNDSKFAIRAKLNKLELTQHLKRSGTPELDDLYHQRESRVYLLLELLQNVNFTKFAPTEAIHYQLKLSELLAEFGNSTEGSSLPLAFRHARAALIQADTLSNLRLKSQAYGTLGKLYLQAEQVEDALNVFDTALKLAQSVNEDSLAYQWSWSIAQIYQQQGERTQAIAAYDTTLKHLNQVRTMLVSANSDLQFSYTESVEPVYHGYLKLLLSTPKPDLQLVLNTHQQLRVAELENFLKCGKLNAVNVSQSEQSDNATQIHILKLDNQVEVIVQNHEGIYRHRPNSALVNRALFNFLVMVDDVQFPNTSERLFQHDSQVLYKQLIAPIQQYLPKEGTLTFYLDSHFQNLPISLLHDGNAYLVKKYSVQIALQTQLKRVQGKTNGKLKVLFAGLSEESPSFKNPDVPTYLQPLPDVEDELAEVQEISEKTTPLINSKFTTDSLKTALNSETPIVHIASHGTFSSNLENTMILAYNEPINALKFHDLISQKSDLGQAAIELLILSACQTAKGDKRSALGIAGMAVQAGSKNILASQWLVDSKATTQLITVFYQGLNNELSNAEALQQAQIKLIDSKQYSHPYYWGAFTLVGG